jgi:type I restriction enzyme S subunit
MAIENNTASLQGTKQFVSLTPKLRFKEFDDNWKQKKLGELGKFKNGLNKDKKDFGFGYPFVNLMDVFGKSILDNTNFGLVNANEKDLLLYNLLEGDVIFIRSSVKRTGVGETILVFENLNKTVYSGFLIRFRESENNLDLLFKRYCFSNTSFRNELLSYATSSANTNINQESLSIIKLNFPSKKEQQKIATFLTSVDTKIQQLTTKKQLLENYKKGVMQQLFSQQLRFKNDDGLDFPDWEVIKVQQLIDKKAIIGLLDGNHGELYPKSEEFTERGIPYVAANNLVNGLVNFTDCKRLPLERASKFKKGIAKNGDVLFAHNATVGPTAILKTDLDFVILSTTVTYYRCNNDILLNSYLLHYFNSDDFIRQYTRVMSQSTRNQVPITMQKKFKIKTPSLKEQQKIAKTLSGIDAKITNIQTQIEKTQAFKKGLLQQMFV